MDEFGVLVESMGFRANGRSAPMAKMKPKSNSNHPSRTSADKPATDDSYSFSVDELDGVFRSNHNIDKTQKSQSFFAQDDVFGAPVTSSNQYGGFDLDSVFTGTGSSRYGNVNSSSKKSDAYDDLLGLGATHGDDDDDSFGSFVQSTASKQEKNKHEVDDLVPGFGGTKTSNSRVSSGNDLQGISNIKPSHIPTTLIDDPFSVFESSGSQSDSFLPSGGSVNKVAEKSSTKSSFDDFPDLKLDGMSISSNNTSSRTTLNEFNNVDYFDRLFGSGNGMETTKVNSSSQNALFDDFLLGEKRPETRGTSKSTSTTKTATPARHEANDFSFLFGDVTTSSGAFNEIDGEPEERRRARLNRHIRTNERMAEALAEKNQRDLQTQQEQEEKRRIAETLDGDIKRWAAGKEGNLRALLSSLQEVLWPECSWRPVPLTDMITSDSVKKVYMKATLHVHPDKVQQKGATLQQKYIAEKVFDKLKEAWNKFRAEELR